MCSSTFQYGLWLIGAFCIIIAGVLWQIFLNDQPKKNIKIHYIDLKANYIRGCYFTNWSQYRPNIWEFTPENIEYGLCTHIFYAFASMGDDFQLKSVEPNDIDVNGTPGLYTRINSIKNSQTDLKTLLTFGGDQFSKSNGPLMQKLLYDIDNRKIFIDSSIAFVRLHKFDGFDFNWIPESDTKNGFALLVKEFREAIDKEADGNGLPALLLTAGVPGYIDRIEAGYNGSVLAESLDWMAFGLWP